MSNEQEKIKDIKIKWFALGTLFGLFFGAVFMLGYMLETQDENNLDASEKVLGSDDKVYVRYGNLTGYCDLTEWNACTVEKFEDRNYWVKAYYATNNTDILSVKYTLSITKERAEELVESYKDAIKVESNLPNISDNSLGEKQTYNSENWDTNLQDCTITDRSTGLVIMLAGCDDAFDDRTLADDPNISNQMEGLETGMLQYGFIFSDWRDMKDVPDTQRNELCGEHELLDSTYLHLPFATKYRCISIGLISTSQSNMNGED